MDVLISCDNMEVRWTKSSYCVLGIGGCDGGASDHVTGRPRNVTDVENAYLHRIALDNIWK